MMSAAIQPQPQKLKRARRGFMYGDLVNGLTVAAFVPLFYTLAVNHSPFAPLLLPLPTTAPSGAPPVPLLFPIYLCASASVNVLCCFISCWTDHRSASLASFALNVVNIFLTTFYMWPSADDGLVVANFVWQLITISANQGHRFPVKAVMGTISATATLTMCYCSPLFSVTEFLPVVGGLLAAFLLLHHVIDLRTDGIEMDEARQKALAVTRKRIRENLATSILAGIFMYHMVPGAIIVMTEPENTRKGIIIVLRAAAYAAIGLVAAGAFQQEVTAKETLQELVEERAAQIVQQAAQIVKQNDELRAAGLALQASESALAITNKQREIVWCNPALHRLAGLDDSLPLFSTRLEEVLKPLDDDTCKFQSCFRETGESELEIVFNEKIILVQVSPSTIAMSAEGNKRFVVVLKDITESRAMEQAIKEAHHEALLSTMNEAMETLTHELRTPLQGIMGMTSLILDNDDGSLEPDTKESLSLVMVSSRLLLTLINNILDVRKCEANMLNDFELYAVPAKPQLTDAVGFCRPLSTIFGVELEMSYAESPIHGSAEAAVALSDSLRIQQVGINLVSNAIKYAPKGSAIKIHSSIMTLTEVEGIIDGALASGEHQSAWDDCTVSKDEVKVLVVSVSDQGQGIDESKKSDLFQKFAQLSDSKERKNNSPAGQPSGTGLGLNLCDKFVHRLKGNIWANNNKNEDGRRGQGANFSFYLPLFDFSGANNTLTAGREDTHVELQTASKLFSSTVFPDCGGLLTPFCRNLSQLRVLLVDDAALNLKVLDRMLERCALAEVVLAGSGAEALEILAKQEFHLVITDIQMPNGMSGNELSESIRDGNLTVKPPVIGLTAETSQDLDRRCVNSGMSYVIHKPITVEKLREFFEILLPVPMRCR